MDCGDCYYYVKKGDVPNGKPSYGECHYNPPVLIAMTHRGSDTMDDATQVDHDSAWPEVRGDNWCGKWRDMDEMKAVLVSRSKLFRDEREEVARRVVSEDAER